MPVKILDAYALMAFFHDERGADMIENLLLNAQDNKIALFLSVVNLGEIWYSIARTHSYKIADSYIQDIKTMPIEIMDVNWEISHQAAMYKARGNISYADCFAAALAKINNAEVVTGDKEFEMLQDDVQILWLK